LKKLQELVIKKETDSIIIVITWLEKGKTDMADKGKKDKGKREIQKKAKLTPKEKRKAKKDNKNK
jgi:hypothetical protein